MILLSGVKQKRHLLYSPSLAPSASPVSFSFFADFFISFMEEKIYNHRFSPKLAVYVPSFRA